ncbi:hypothetical protein CWB76_11390 [Pseudoalteromonas sp. S1609]|uniref:hypothetical protein n=1 Tax=Pseudoalteromonas sp. S1609 TaxID=579505 RepID=UPI00110B12E8|nr:hypothetical protein [Pseudoalteromonas sp. S1609]TMP70225.1 hypothetical protein CWB76_11390 [Pseudoalteromonas sp. S1609]
MLKTQQIQMNAKVRYYPLLKNKDVFTEHVITSECWEVCGETVVKISDKSGGVSIEHLELI